MTLQCWAVNALKQKRLDSLRDVEVCSTDESLIMITRSSGSLEWVYCPDTDLVSAAGGQQLVAKHQQKPPDFVLLIRANTEPSFFIAADEIGVPVGGMGDLIRALESSDSLKLYNSGERTYLEKRLKHAWKIESFERCNLDCYLVTWRTSEREEVCFVEDYEITAELVHHVIEANPGRNIAKIVTTNPNTKKIAAETEKLVSDTGVRLFVLKDYLISG